MQELKEAESISYEDEARKQSQQATKRGQACLADAQELHSK